jgi:hypothetical protein
MEDRDPVVSASASEQTASTTRHYEDRSVWVVTAYGISGLALFGLLAYFISDFLSH